MTREKQTSSDATDLKLLDALRQDARLSYAELGRLVHLSAPAVRERISRLELDGIITGYHARVAPDRMGYPIQAYLRLTTPAEFYPRVLAEVERIPEIQSCAHVTGEDAFVLQVMARTTADLERIIACLSTYGKTSTAIILSIPVKKS